LTGSKPLVSIIIPTRNSEDTIASCLRSIKAQTYDNIETIVVDNYSQDRTVAIAKRFGAKVFLKGPERAAQVNLGVTYAKGKYVYRVDSDFELEPDVVKEAVEKSESLGYDGVLIHNTSDPTISFWAKVRKMERDSYRQDEIHVATRFCKKKVFGSLCGFDDSLVAGDDYDFQNRLVEGGYKIGRIKAQETHIGEPRNITEVVRKHYYYGKNIRPFIQKNPKKALTQLGPARPSVAARLLTFSNKPVLIAGFLLYQFIRYFAATAGLISAVLFPTISAPTVQIKPPEKQGWIGKIGNRRTIILIVLSFLLLNLRVLFWFQPGYVLSHGDFRFPLNAGAFLHHALEPVNQIDFGIPSVYAPRILDPFTDILLLLEYLGAAAWIAELLAAYVAYVVVSLLVFVLVRRLTGSSVAAFAGAFFFTTNTFLVVDEGQIAIGYMDLALALLPSIVAFVEALHRNSYRFALMAGLLFCFSFSFYPNYRQVLQAIASIAVFSIFYLLKDRVTASKLRIKAKLLGAFAIAGGAASSWVIALAAISYGSFQAAFNQAYAPQLYLSFHPSLFDTFRLIAKWSFYSEALGRPYIPYSSIYLNNPILIALTYFPVAFGFASLLLTKRRKTALYYSLVVLIFLLLTGGVVSLAGLPLMVVFRETFNYLWIALLSLSVLIGLATSSIYERFKKRKYQVLVLVAVVALLSISAYPLFNGDVSRGLDANHKGSYIPAYLSEVNNYADDYVLLLPQRRQYVVYDFADKGWLVVGNIYPMTFDVPYVAGIGTEYLLTEQPDRVNLCYRAALLENGTEAADILYKQGIRYILAENTIIFGNLTTLANYTALLNSNSLTLVKTWNEATLYKLPS
jgi:glycosyltransferase involved in cell wall biosynthesis